jgi:hypothetical protein
LEAQSSLSIDTMDIGAVSDEVPIACLQATSSIFSYASMSATFPLFHSSTYSLYVTTVELDCVLACHQLSSDPPKDSHSEDDCFVPRVPLTVESTDTQEVLIYNRQRLLI